MHIPHFVVPTVKNAGRRISSAASVPEEFIEIAAVGIANNEELVRPGAARPDQMRDYIDYAIAYLPVAEELEALAGFVRYSVAEAKSKAGTEALITYSLVKRLAKRPETSKFARLAESMRRALGGRFRKAKRG